jgi:hypothetical protein
MIEDNDIEVAQDEVVEVVETQVEQPAKPKKEHSIYLKDGVTLRKPGGRPKKDSRPAPVAAKLERIARADRVPVTDFRDRLVVKNQDPDYHYYWQIGSHENDAPIIRYLNGGYDLVRDNEGVIAGEKSVTQSRHGNGDPVTVPNGDGRWLYLMKIHKDLHTEDQEIAQSKQKAIENAVFNGDSVRQSGFQTYGKVGYDS